MYCHIHSMVCIHNSVRDKLSLLSQISSLPCERIDDSDCLWSLDISWHAYGREASSEWQWGWKPAAASACMQHLSTSCSLKPLGVDKLTALQMHCTDEDLRGRNVYISICFSLLRDCSKFAQSYLCRSKEPLPNYILRTCACTYVYVHMCMYICVCTYTRQSRATGYIHKSKPADLQPPFWVLFQHPLWVVEHNVNVCIPEHLQVLYGWADALQRRGGGVSVAVKQHIKCLGREGGEIKGEENRRKMSVEQCEISCSQDISHSLIVVSSFTLVVSSFTLVQFKLYNITIYYIYVQGSSSF